MALREYSLLVIGAGPGGLVVALGAAKAGRRVLLIEAGNYGGDCTNYGCIPSKSLIASAKVAYDIRQAAALGITIPPTTINADEALHRARTIIQTIQEQELPSSLHEKGVETLTGEACFIDKKTVEVRTPSGEIEHIRGKTIVIATGSRPFIPEIPGLQDVPYLTNETLFSLETIPQQLIILGGGPIGCEMGQAFQRLGSQVTLVGTRPVLLPREEPEAQRILQGQFEKEGIALYLGYQTENVRKVGDTIAVTVRPTKGEEQIVLSGSHLLLAVGRRPHIKELNLDAAKIKYSSKGIEIDPYGRTSQKNIWCIGDASGAPFYTHMAEAQGRAVLTSFLLPVAFKKKVDRSQQVPHVTFTDPEVARLGPMQEELETRYPKSKLATYFVPYTEVDRAYTTGETNGFVKISTKKWSSHILGATIVGPRAGEMLCQLSTAVKGRVSLHKMAAVIHPYPTFSQAIRKAAEKYMTETVLPAVRKKRPWRWKLWIFLTLVLLTLAVFGYYFGGSSGSFEN